MSAALDHFARRAAADPLYLAHRVAAYQLATGTDDAALCARLGVTPEVLTRLRCCGAPRHAADVRAIAARYGVAVEVLTDVAG